MPRIIGVDIPGKKRVAIALRHIYGIGPSMAEKIVKKAKISEELKADD